MDILNNVISEESNLTGTQYETLGAFFSVVLNYMLGIGLGLSTVFLIVSGIKFMESRGDPRAVDTAKNQMVYSILAFLICGGALTIKAIVLRSIGVSDVDIEGGTTTF